MTAKTTRECSIARSLEVLGERWTLLALRELMFGVHRFDQIVAATGAPRDVLTTRLRTLEASGLVERRQYSQHPPRHEYHLTPAGQDAGDVLLALMAFGDRHSRAQPPVRWHHGDHLLEPVVTCQRCGQPAAIDLHDPIGPGAPTTSS